MLKIKSLLQVHMCSMQLSKLGGCLLLTFLIVVFVGFLSVKCPAPPLNISPESIQAIRDALSPDIERSNEYYYQKGKEEAAAEFAKLHAAHKDLQQRFGIWLALQRRPCDYFELVARGKVCRLGTPVRHANLSMHVERYASPFVD